LSQCLIDLNESEELVCIFGFFTSSVVAEKFVALRLLELLQSPEELPLDAILLGESGQKLVLVLDDGVFFNLIDVIRQGKILLIFRLFSQVFLVVIVLNHGLFLLAQHLDLVLLKYIVTIDEI